MRHLQKMLIALILFSGFNASADMALGIQTNLITMDDIQMTSAPKGSDKLYDAYFLISLAKDSSFFLGLGYLQISNETSISATATSTLTSTNPYIGVNYFFCKRFCSLGVYTAQWVTATYSQAQSETWTGTAFYAKLGLHPVLRGSLALDISLAYYSANFSTRTSVTNVSSVNSFTQTVTAPMIGLQYAF